MQTKTYRRKPFIIEAVEITNDNIDEIGELIGVVMTREEDGAKFIQVNPVVVPGIPRAYLGFWLTVMNDRYRCYSGKIFRAQFEQIEPEENGQTHLPSNQQTIPYAEYTHYDAGL